MTVFRREAIDSQRKRLDGNVSLALPLSWQLFGILLFCIVIASIIFLLIGSYSRIETVSGTVQPADGVARIIPPASGTLDKLFVKAGDTVTAGSSLAVIRTGMTLSEGLRSSEAQMEILHQQERGLSTQQAEINAAARSRANELDSEIADRRAAIVSLTEQIGIQTKIVDTARVDLDRAREIAARGFVSKQEINQRTEAYYARQQDLLRLQRDLDQNRHNIAEAFEKKSTLRAEAGAQLASLASQQSDIAQRRTQSSAQEAYRLNAPVDGSVAVIAAKLGDNVSSGKPLMLILPKGSPLRAELNVPSSAIGFLAVGQPVRLAVNAFPYQHYGTVPGHIDSIATAPIAANGADGSQQSYYRVTASLERDWVMAYGKRQPLVTGMECSAEIVTEKRTLMQWLLSPLLSTRAE